MRFSAKERYGLKAMIDMAARGGHKPLSAKAIAEKQDISIDYLEQIFRQLRKARLLKSVRGPRGGFVLAKPAADITVWEVMSALEGQQAGAPCNGNGCESERCKTSNCIASGLWARLDKDMRDTLTAISIGEIIKEGLPGTASPRMAQPQKPQDANGPDNPQENS